MSRNKVDRAAAEVEAAERTLEAKKAALAKAQQEAAAAAAAPKPESFLPAAERDALAEHCSFSKGTTYVACYASSSRLTIYFDTSEKEKLPWSAHYKAPSGNEITQARASTLGLLLHGLLDELEEERASLVSAISEVETLQKALRT